MYFPASQLNSLNLADSLKHIKMESALAMLPNFYFFCLFTVHVLKETCNQSIVMQLRQLTK